jgi:hypothetical protein
MCAKREAGMHGRGGKEEMLNRIFLHFESMLLLLAIYLLLTTLDYTVALFEREKERRDKAKLG